MDLVCAMYTPDVHTYTRLDRCQRRVARREKMMMMMRSGLVEIGNASGARRTATLGAGSCPLTPRTPPNLLRSSPLLLYT